MSNSTQHPSLQGKVVLVTGAASGLGAALARRLAASGASIFGVDRQAARLADNMAQLRELGVQAHALGVDIADPTVAPRVVEHAVDVLGRLD
uniref:SDR family NAD(P)-dependent oxidoreductase n=1 Tax=Massilia sp. UBA6681 TaxID=1946839 RepID=UPI0025BF59A5